MSDTHLPPPSPGRPRVLIAAFGGWSDAGGAATTALEHLERSLRLTLLHTIGSEGYVDLQMYRPQLVQHSDGTRSFEWPDSRFLGPFIRPDESGFFSTALPHVLPDLPPDASVRSMDGEPVDHIYLFEGTEPAHHWQSYADEIVDLVDAWAIDLVVFVGSMFSDAPHSRPILISVTSEDAEVRSAYGAERSTYEGPVGIASIVEHQLIQAGVSTLQLWAQVPHYVHSAPSPKATLALLDRCEDLLNILIPRGDLLTEATEWEQNIDQLANQDEEMNHYIRRLEEARDSFEGPEATGDAIAYELEQFLQVRPDESREQDGEDPPADPGSNGSR